MSVVCLFLCVFMYMDLSWKRDFNLNETTCLNKRLKKGQFLFFLVKVSHIECRGHYLAVWDIRLTKFVGCMWHGTIIDPITVTFLYLFISRFILQVHHTGCQRPNTYVHVHEVLGRWTFGKNFSCQFALVQHAFYVLLYKMMPYSTQYHTFHHTVHCTNNIYSAKVDNEPFL